MGDGARDWRGVLARGRDGRFGGWELGISGRHGEDDVRS